MPAEAERSGKNGTGPRGRAEGERQAGVDPNKPKERVESRTGTAKYRIPDESDAKSIKEVKNVKELKITNQLKDLAKEAKASLREFTLKLRDSTTIGPSAQRFIDENAVKVESPISARPLEVPVVEPLIAEPVIVEPVIPIEPIIIP